MHFNYITTHIFVTAQRSLKRVRLIAQHMRQKEMLGNIDTRPIKMAH